MSLVDLSLAIGPVVGKPVRPSSLTLLVYEIETRPQYCRED